MIPFIRSFSELMAISESKVKINKETESKNLSSLNLHNKERKRCLTSIKGKGVEKLGSSKIKRVKSINSKEPISRILWEIDYNNEIPLSYDFTLIARQKTNNYKDAA